MTESAVETPATPAATTPKKKKIPAKSKGSAAKRTASHPPTSSMVNAAIKSLNERGGSSLQAIKKYISGTYKVDAEKLAPFIKKYLKSAADKGALIRTKGKGASGSFKLAAKGEGKKKAVTPKKKKPAAKKAASTPKAKKAKTAKKPVVKKAAKPKAAAKPTTPKVKKVKKAKTPKKPKTPKPKKTTTTKKAKKSVAKK